MIPESQKGVDPVLEPHMLPVMVKVPVKVFA
jgi:hypothetical protein